ncbi:hypothetical protein KOR42_09790 [Thalassoglobus neptunius]|uniref:Uncharacterized protein n=1 Tax=Thalassoglobus neptunius TaxID=1938619 RepID=A0A5C5X3E9_9PLAN|nr:hypothetical protein [Thalassoglobus neptunius]TWT57617.1 hypothetical protein KOR42_09790 [Thalassoglobus neptunius]
MTAKFAGSGSLDDRRRRRLAQTSSEVAPPPSQRSQTSPPSERLKRQSKDLPTTKSDVVADESIVPASLWKLIAFGLVGLLAFLFLVGVSLAETELLGLAQLICPPHGSGFQFFSVIFLTLSAQLSWLIFWYRSRSRKDFSGRYRIWGWAASFWAINCLSIALKLHRPIAVLLFEQWPIYCWQAETWYWFVPFSVGALTLHQMLAREMRWSPQSRWMWRLTLAVGIAGGSLTIGMNRFIPVELRDVALDGTVALWHYLITMTLLLHVRFVVHVTNEAAPSGKSALQKVKDRVFEKTAPLRAWWLKRQERRQQLRSEKNAKRLVEKEKRDELKKQKLAERNEAAEKLKREKQEKKAALNQAKQAERDQKKEDAKRQKELAAEEAKKKRLERDQAKAAQKTAAQNQRKTSKTVQAEASAAEKNVKEELPSAESKTNAKPTERAKPSPKPAPAKSSSRKKPRVLGKVARTDQAESIPKAHIQPAEANTDIDFLDDEDVDLSKLSKSERRRLRKLQKRRARERAS